MSNEQQHEDKGPFVATLITNRGKEWNEILGPANQSLEWMKPREEAKKLRLQEYETMLTKLRVAYLSFCELSFEIQQMKNSILNKEDLKGLVDRLGTIDVEMNDAITGLTKIVKEDSDKAMSVIKSHVSSDDPKK